MGEKLGAEEETWLWWKLEALIKGVGMAAEGETLLSWVWESKKPWWEGVWGRNMASQEVGDCISGGWHWGWGWDGHPGSNYLTELGISPSSAVSKDLAIPLSPVFIALLFTAKRNTSPTQPWLCYSYWNLEGANKTPNLKQMSHDGSSGFVFFFF